MFNHFMFWLDICLASKQNSDLQDWKRNFEISSPPLRLELKKGLYLSLDSTNIFCGGSIDLVWNNPLIPTLSS
jgi:hypothetical protein